MDWKEDIGNFFADQNIHRSEFLNKLLQAAINEWCNYLQLFERINIKDDIRMTESFDSHSLEISIRSILVFPIIVKIRYGRASSGKGIALYLKYSIGLNARDMIDGGENPYKMKEDEITDSRFIYENKFIMQELNNILKAQVSSGQF